MAGRRVSSGDGGDDNHAVALAHAFGSVNGLAAAHAHDAGALVFSGHGPEALHFLPGALAAEVAGHKFHAEFFSRLVQLLFHPFHVAVQGNQQRGIAEGLDEITQIQQLVLALHVLSGADKCLSHNNASLKI